MISPTLQRVWKRVIQTLEDVLDIKDNIFIYGFGNTEEEVNIVQDRKLIQFLERSRSMGVAPNPNKLKLRGRKVTFMGYELTDEGKGRSTLSQSNDGNTETH